MINVVTMNLKNGTINIFIPRYREQDDCKEIDFLHGLSVTFTESEANNFVDVTGFSIKSLSKIIHFFQ